MRWRIDLEYDGAGFAGWQIQPNGRTVQQVVADAVEAFVGHPVKIAGSGRTDAGVHALQQVAAFDTTTERRVDQVLAGVNHHLPDEVSLVHAEVVPDDFDPRRWVLGKRYRYRILDRGRWSALRRGRVWRLRPELDAPKMHEAAQHLVGRHDFTSFRASGCTALHPTRVVKALSVSRVDDEVHVEAFGNGFLRHMVRIVSGTLVDVGRGARSADWMAEVLEAKSRTAAGRTAPAEGLTLVEVVVGDGPQPWKHQGG